MGMVAPSDPPSLFPAVPPSSSNPAPVKAVLGAVPLPDPARGLKYLLHGDYIGAGIPIELWKLMNAVAPMPSPRQWLQREGVDASVPDEMNQYFTPKGVEVVSAVNCLGCHASAFRGKLVIGLGNSLRDWPPDATPYAPLRGLGLMRYKAGTPERETLLNFLRGAETLAGRTAPPTRGLNPAFRFEEVSATHRNPADLSWTEQPIYAVPEAGVWSDVPAWWNVRKKLTLYYNGMGQGDFARLVQQIGVVMMGDAEDARRTLPQMRDVLAYINTLRAPVYPGVIDEGLRGRGAVLFSARCSDCHGTYGERWTYPNRLVPVEKVGTDPVYAERVKGSNIHEWFNKSWFAGNGAAYAEPTLAYVAPPLDGVWCTAPYFHNGSVPTLEGVLNSRVRPKVWQRSFKDDDYDIVSPGWRFKAVSPEPGGSRSRDVYDTSIPGCGNGGHTYGDDFSDDERRALIEYLKTL